ncbi:hypothetical protein [Streptomyces caniscabiei]|uniref:hypothetical protein n=1 Tax=Streptomyces caniscabiei TaxID=2746961 RepID=UPI0009A0D7A7|nr:hypothetical protein [Streptomyces caniscabiei]
MIVTINVAVLLIIVVVRLRRTTHSRSRFDEKMTVVLCVTLGVLLAPTAFGKSVLDVVTQLVEGLSQSGQ